MKVEFEDGVLTVQGERKHEKGREREEVPQGRAGIRQVRAPLCAPTEVDAAKVSAEFKEGVLNVHLPKSPNGKPKAIAVKVT